MKITKQYIQENLINNKGKINPYALKRENITNIEVYNIFNEIIIIPKCICKEELKFISFSKGYRKTCGKIECKNSTMLKSIKQTNLEKYGVEHYFNLEKSKQTKLEKYGNEKYNNSIQRKQTRESRKLKGIQYSSIILNLDKLTTDYITENFIENGFFKRENFLSFFNCKETFAYKKLKELNIQYKRTKSHKENEINEKFNNIFVQGNRKLIAPLELDLLSDDHKFAIEYNGLIPHSYGKHRFKIFNNTIEDKNYHLRKTILCEDKGIQLYHIFENEWLNENKKSIWISMINDKLNKNTKIGARKCVIKEVHVKEARKFVDENHIQGYCNALIKIGLYYKGELVSIMIFGKSRFNKAIEYELIRFCSKRGYTIQGGGSRILSYFENVYRPKSLISYANRRWSTGNFYIKSGFVLSHITVPNFFYFLPKENILWSRNKFQKHKQDILLNIFDKTLTGTENMYMNGYRKIFDCGNKVFIKEYYIVKE